MGDDAVPLWVLYNERALNLRQAGEVFDQYFEKVLHEAGSSALEEV